MSCWLISLLGMAPKDKSLVRPPPPALTVRTLLFTYYFPFLKILRKRKTSPTYENVGPKFVTTTLGLEAQLKRQAIEPRAFLAYLDSFLTPLMIDNTL